MRGDIVTVKWWNDGRHDYNIDLRRDNESYWFEGKYRDSAPLGRGYGGRHTFFPDEFVPELRFKSKEAAVRFVREQLPLWKCPANIVDEILAELG